MSEQLAASFILYFWILTVFLSPVVRGQVRVVGASEPVFAHVGGDVTLPCHCDPNTDLTPLTVEWSRAELRPHPSDRLKRVPFVHVYTDHRDDDPDMKIPEFTNRTQLFPDQLAAGVASLRIHNVALSDNGTYKCFIPNLRTQRSLRWTHVTLIVDAVDAATAATHAPDLTTRRDDSDGHPQTPTQRSGVPKMVSFLLIGVLIVLAAVLYHKPLKKDDSPQKAEPRERENSVAVHVEDVKLLVPQQS